MEESIPAWRALKKFMKYVENMLKICAQNIGACHISHVTLVTCMTVTSKAALKFNLKLSWTSSERQCTETIIQKVLA